MPGCRPRWRCPARPGFPAPPPAWCPSLPGCCRSGPPRAPAGWPLPSRAATPANRGTRPTAPSPPPSPPPAAMPVRPPSPRPFHPPERRGPVPPPPGSNPRCSRGRIRGPIWCATVTWIKLCAQLLRLTGDPVWADEMELSLYNAMVGAMTPDGEWFSYFTQLTGERVPSFIAHADLNLSCCVASGPRGLLLTPRWAVMTARGGPVVNLYAPGTASLQLADGRSEEHTSE